jgi:ubiquitin-protein ligase
MAARIAKEVKNASFSMEYDFFMDEGKYSDVEPNNCYLRFTVKSGLYTGQTHIIRIKFDYGSNVRKMYPMHPPNCIFLTPMWHTNVSREGGICVDILREDSSDPNAWSPLYGVDAIFHSILLLLEEHNGQSPYNGEASKQFKAAKEAGNMSSFVEIANQYYRTKMASTGDGSMLLKILSAPEFEKKETKK